RSTPVVDDLVVAPGTRINPQTMNTGSQTVTISFGSSGQSDTSTDDSSTPLAAVKDRTSVTVRWSAHDEDGSKMSYSLYLRGDNEKEWWPLKKDLKQQAYSFDATQIPDGGYRVKVVASDAPSQPPGDAATGLTATPETVACKQTPCPQQVRVVFDATDATSPIARADYSLDAGTWQFVAPVGGLSDARHEHYQFLVPASAF